MRDTSRARIAIIPSIQIVICEVTTAEDKVFREKDDEILRTPVSEQRKEVLQVHVELFATTESQGKDCNKAEECPDEARNSSKRSGELLAGDGGAVYRDNDCVDTGEYQEGEYELCKATRIWHVLNQVPQSIVLVGIFQFRSSVET